MQEVCIAKQYLLILFLTFPTAINIILILPKECLITVGTQLLRGSFIHQHEGEHHLYLPV